MNDHELRDALRSAADQVQLRPGAAGRARAAGLRRRHRRRRAGVTVMTVAALGGALVGLDQLTRAERSPVASDTDRGAPDTTAAPPVATPAGEPIEARLGAPTMTWRRIDPDSAAAVGSPLSPSFLASPSALPGVMVSTVSGQSGARQLWRSDDGVTWSAVGPLPDGASAADAWNAGGRTYVVGTMPASAGSASGTVRVTVSDDGGASWNGIDLPVSDPELTALAGDGGVETQIGGIAGTGDATLVLVQQRLALGDPMGLIKEAGFDPDRYGLAEDGLRDYVCDGATPTTVSAVAVGPGGTTADTAGSATTTPAEESKNIPSSVLSQCGDGSPAYVPYSELGDVGVRLQAAMFPRSHLFVTTDGATFEEVTLPTEADSYQLVATGDRLVLVASRYREPGSGELWQTGDGRTWQPLSGPGGDFTGLVRSVGGRLLGVSWSERGAVPNLLDAGGAWQPVDLGPVVGGGTPMLQPSLATTSAAGLVLAAAVNGPDDGTGSQPMRWELLQTADGLTWSSQSIAELAGVAAADIGSVTRVQAAGGTVVVAVSLVAAPDETPTQLVLVGTPNG